MARTTFGALAGAFLLAMITSPMRAQAPDPIRYTLRFPAPHTHYVEVDAVYPTGRQPAIEIYMAVWTPGSHLVREYQRHVEHVTASDGGRSLVAEKSRKNRWRIITGGAPEVTLLNMVVDAGGGLEHKNSFLTMSSRFVTRTRRSYLGWLALVAHEYFHNWNIKRLRPVELGPFDYENENYVKTLWVAEGFTDYYADLLVHRAGLSNVDEYLDALSNQIEAVQTTPGRLVSPVNSASYDTWIKQYRPDENTPNTTIDYYPKGAVIAFLLDAKIRRATGGARSLDDGMRLALQRYGGEKGYTPAQFYQVMSEAAGIDLSAFFASAAESTDELDYRDALDYYGLRFHPVDSRTARAFLGATTRADNGRLIVSGVRRGTPAIDAGLNVNDEIIAIDDVRVRADGLGTRLEQYQPGDRIHVLVARRDTLLRLDVTLGADPGRPWRLDVQREATEAQRANRVKWMGAR